MLRQKSKAGQHILYLSGELSRLVNGLSAHQMATVPNQLVLYLYLQQLDFIGR